MSDVGTKQTFLSALSMLNCVMHTEDNVVKSSNDDYASADHDPTHRPNLYAGGPRIN